jgi:hypothetical protein
VAEVIRIPLRRRDGTVRAYTLIDPVDAGQALHRWFVHTLGYAYRSQYPAPRRTLLLHREILGLTLGDGLEADHINGDRLDNRRCNLRIVTHAENHQNLRSERGSTSRYRGVSWSKEKGKWQVQVSVNGHRHSLGYFAYEELAAEAARAFRLANMPYTTER